ncbi:MAG: glycosyltransferase [Desulfovibrionaceae bacterium]
MKIDLHVHSKHSARPSEWILKKMGCPESFVEPLAIYREALAKGMDAVTISDHNTIDGALEIAHLDRVFISEEVTARFPDSQCKVHVLVHGIDEAVHDEAQRLRRNVFELVAYLRGAGVRHAIAHPLYGVNYRLTEDIFEKCLLLFDVFEINGSRDGLQSRVLETIVGMLSPTVVEQLANRHGIAPHGAAPWQKSLIGGSDDHSGLNIARIHTEVEGAHDMAAFWAGVDEGRSKARGAYANPKAMAHNLYGIGYQYYKHKYDLARHVGVDGFVTFLDRLLSIDATPQTGFSKRVKSMLHNSRLFGSARTDHKELHLLLRNEAEALVRGEKRFAAVAEKGSPGGEKAEDLWFDFANRAANKVLAGVADRALTSLTHANIFTALQSVGEIGALSSALTPYFVSYGLFTKDRAFCRSVMRRFTDGDGNPDGHFKVAHFTDTFFETNGVAITLRDQVRAARASGKAYEVLVCRSGRADGTPGVRTFTPVGGYDMPEYPEITVYYPPVLELLAYVYENGFTHIHAATPGPMGLAALLVASILKLPIAGTYHTAIPQYARDLTGDEAMEDGAWKYVAWFYNQLDTVYAPSRFVGDELAARGIGAARIKVYPRGVDVARFTPAKRNGFFKKYALNGAFKLLYVGRVSREKNLMVLEEAFRALHGVMPLDLVVVGDGPYRATMERNLAGTPCLFTGYLSGEALAEAFASSDLFVFPSTTDTFGNVVLQAQASGLPVIVSNEGGPRENVIDRETGLVIPANDVAALANAIIELATDPARLRTMSRNARAAMEGRSFDRAFDRTWNMYRQVGRDASC